MATGFAAQELRSFINRLERLNEERDAISTDIKEVYAEAKGTGFDTKIMRMLLKIRKMDAATYQEQCALLDLYLTAMQLPDGESDRIRAAGREVLKPESEATGAPAH